MLHKARSAYRITTALFLVGVLVQVFLAGLGIFAHPANIKGHILMALVLHGLSLAMWVLAAYGRLPLPTTRLNGVLFFALFVQGALPHLRGIIPAVAALHPVNAIAIFAIALVLARRERAFAWMRPKSGIAERLVHAVEC